MDIRTGENARESWWVTNNTNKTITIGDLLLLPVLNPGKKVDLLHYYTREKVSHSIVLANLVKSGKVSLNKQKYFNEEKTSTTRDDIPISDIDDAITPAEENEVGGNGTSGGSGTSGTSGSSGTSGTSGSSGTSGISGESVQEIGDITIYRTDGSISSIETPSKTYNVERTENGYIDNIDDGQYVFTIFRTNGYVSRVNISEVS